MKKYIISVVITLSLISISLLAPAQPPYTPPNPYINGNGTQIAGNGLHNSPIDGGLGVFLLMAAAYGIRKIYNAKRKVS